MSQHIVLDLVLVQAGAAVSAEFIAAAILNIYAFPSALKLLLFAVAGEVVAADRTLDQRGKDVGIVAPGGVCFCGRDLPELLKLCPCDVRHTVFEVILITAGIGLVFKKTIHLIAGGGTVAVFLQQIVVGAADRIAGAVVLESVLHDARDGLVLYKPVVDHLVAVTGAHTAGNLTDGPFVVQHGLDALRSAVTLRLVHGEHDVDDHLAVGGGGVVVLKDGLPVTVMGLQDLLGDIVVLDVSKPPVQLGDKDHVDLILFHVIQEPQESFAVLHRLAGRDTLIRIVTHDRITVMLGILRESALLGRKREPVEVLLLGADTDIDGATLYFRHGSSSCTAYWQQGIKMPGDLYFHRENDIIHLLRANCIGILGMVPIHSDVGSIGAGLTISKNHV